MTDVTPARGVAADFGARRSARSNPTRDRIVAAAGRLFERQGYDPTSMDDIAVEANVTKPTVYYHFSNKEALYTRICTQHTNRSARYLEDLRHRECTPAERLIDLVWNLVAGCVHSQTTRLLFDNSARVSSSAVQVIRQSQHQYVDEMAKVLEEAQADGDALPGDPRLMALAAFEAIGRISRWYDPNGRIPPDEAGPTMVRMFLRAFLREDVVVRFDSQLVEAGTFFPERFSLIHLSGIESFYATSLR